VVGEHTEYVRVMEQATVHKIIPGDAKVSANICAEQCERMNARVHFNVSLEHDSVRSNYKEKPLNMLNPKVSEQQFV